MEPLSPLEQLYAFINYLKYEATGEWPAHLEEVQRMNDELLKRPLGKPGIQNNPYDRAKNYSGGYDFGYRSGNETVAERLARKYQSETDNASEGEQDYIQNMVGVLAGIEDRKKGKRLSFEELIKEAEKYGLQLNEQR